jgi:hypothetical protein
MGFAVRYGVLASAVLLIVACSAPVPAPAPAPVGDQPDPGTLPDGATTADSGHAEASVVNVGGNPDGSFDASTNALPDAASDNADASPDAAIDTADASSDAAVDTADASPDAAVDTADASSAADAGAAPRCDDGIMNGTETDVDCGGGVCATCGAASRCAKATDCRSGNCQGGVCQMQGICGRSGGACTVPGSTCIMYGPEVCGALSPGYCFFQTAICESQTLKFRTSSSLHLPKDLGDEGTINASPCPLDTLTSCGFPNNHAICKRGDQATPCINGGTNPFRKATRNGYHQCEYSPFGSKWVYLGETYEACTPAPW